MHILQGDMVTFSLSSPNLPACKIPLKVLGHELLYRLLNVEW